MNSLESSPAVLPTGASPSVHPTPPLSRGTLTEVELKEIVGGFLNASPDDGGVFIAHLGLSSKHPVGSS